MHKVPTRSLGIPRQADFVGQTTAKQNAPAMQRKRMCRVRLERNKMNLPKCERKGTQPHPATMLLVWDLASGRQVRYSCDEHAADRFGSKHTCIVARIVGYNDAEKDE